MFKFVTFAALLSVARAGNLLSSALYGAAPVAYAAPATAPFEIHAPAIGTSHQSVVRSLDGNSAVSQYSKAVDTAFSSVRKYDTRVTNDAQLLAPATLSYAAPAALSYASPAYAAPAPIGYAGYAAPAHAYAAGPISYAAPAQAYAAPAAIGYAGYAGYAAPAHAYAAGPIIKSHASFSGLGAAYAF